jgi:hypothetical protein
VLVKDSAQVLRTIMAITINQKFFSFSSWLGIIYIIIINC